MHQDAAEAITDMLGQRLDQHGSFSYATAGRAPVARLLATWAQTTDPTLLTQRVPSDRAGPRLLVHSAPTGKQLLMLQGDLVRALLDDGTPR